MSDERTREAERRWRATGSQEDRAAMLLARVRSGALELERLRGAAGTGDPACVAALRLTDPARSGAPKVVRVTRQLAVEAVAGAVPTRECYARVLVALLVAQEQAGCLLDCDQAVATALEDAATCGCPQSWARLHERHSRATLIASEGQARPSFARYLPGIASPDASLLDRAHAFLQAAGGLSVHLGLSARPSDAEEVARAREGRGRGTLWDHGVDALQADLVPWLLRERDPVGDRFLEFRSGECGGCWTSWAGTDDDAFPWERRLGQRG